MAVTLGKYTIERELGRGAMGIAYLATDTSIGRQVALKVLILPHTLQGAQRANLIQRFLREARAVAAVEHPVVPKIYEVGAVGDQHFIAMEYCPGVTLKESLTTGGPMPVPLATSVMLQLLAGLGAAHALGICHRDVKPDNVMLAPDDGTVKLMDFGIARMEGELTLTGTGAVLGTPSYMSPEQLSGRGVDGRTDLFAAGVLLHELVTGTRPFEGGSLVEIAHAIGHLEPNLSPALPPELIGVVRRALMKNAADRFQTAEEMSAALVMGALPNAPGAAASHSPFASPASPFAPFDDTLFPNGPQIGGAPPRQAAPQPSAVPPAGPAVPGYPSVGSGSFAPSMPATGSRNNHLQIVGAVVACLAAGAFLVTSFGGPGSSPPKRNPSASQSGVGGTPGVPSAVTRPADAPQIAAAPSVTTAAPTPRAADELRGTPWDPGPRPWSTAAAEAKKAAKANKNAQPHTVKPKFPPRTGNPQLAYVGKPRKPNATQLITADAKAPQVAAPASASEPAPTPAAPAAAPRPAPAPEPMVAAPAPKPAVAASPVTPPAAPAPARAAPVASAAAPPAPKLRFNRGSDHEIYMIQPDIARQYGILTGKPIPMPDRYGYWYKTIDQREAWNRYQIHTTFPIPDPAIYGKPPVPLRRIPVPDELK